MNDTINTYSSKLKKATKYDHIHSYDTKTIVDELYQHFVSADKYINNLKKGTAFNYKLTKINMISQIPKPSEYDSYYFPTHIQKYINDEASYTLHYSCKIKGRELNIYFIIFNELSSEEVLELNKAVHMIYMWIYIINIYAIGKCSKSISLYVYMTPFKKMFPDNQLITLNAEHVNSGYTSGCRKNTEIILFRKEEWFKVFLHETFHNFGLDFSDIHLYHVNMKLKEMFNVNIEYKLYESYCETWARIINVMFYTFDQVSQHMNSTQLVKSLYTPSEQFIQQFNTNMIIEANHSLVQALKVLHFMDLSYKLITRKTTDNITACNHLYRENTAVFSYYIITGILINNYSDFMTWCNNNNTSLLLFKKTPTSLDNYLKLIQSCVREPEMNKNITRIEKILNNMNTKEYTDIKSLQMTIIDNFE